ncbi:MAG: phosphodiester glycosidase family protein [Gemmatimonadaceae bacterium]
MTHSTGRRAAAAIAAAALASGAGAPDRVGDELPRSALRVYAAGEWRPWWSSERAPTRWTSAPLADAVDWRPGAAPGLEWGTLRLAGSGEAWRLKVVVVRLDPARFRFRLPQRADGDRRGAWTVDSATAGATLALNAGQFARATPWGWLVRAGQELQPPGRGPLSAAFVVDGAGGASIVPAESLEVARARRDVREAFQSYPAALLGDGEVPAALRAPGGGIDVAHRDARLAVGELRDGRLVVALTRFDAAGEALQALPFGLTVPETAALMGALGARRALLLDGGISAQLAVRDASGSGQHVWHGLRAVPMGLEAVPAP